MSKRQDRQRQRMCDRNRAVRQFFNTQLEKNPQWRHSAIVELTADKFWLAEGTVDAIMLERPPYDDNDEAPR